MEKKDLTTNRRSFIGKLATGTAAVTIGSIAAPLKSIAREKNHFVSNDDPDAWFRKLDAKKHKMVFDVTEPNGMMPFAWPRVFLMTNGMTGTQEKDMGVVVVLRHDAIPYALNSSVWTKYKLGEVFKINDDKTKTASLRNAFWKPGKDDFIIPGIGPVAIGINDLQDSGVLFAACNSALVVYSAAIAAMTNMKQDEVYKDFVGGVLPGIQVVPSGVWAVSRAQEHGCSYCFG